MKKISLIFIGISILALVLVGACGGDNGEEETTTAAATTTTSAAATTTGAAATTTPPQTTQPSNGGGGGGDLTWDDMPIYPGADQIQEFSISMPMEDEEYSEVEWRYYECDASVEDVVDFYKDEMPDYGWEEMMWMDMSEIAYGMYMKNNEEDAAMVWIAAEGGDTLVGLWRASE